MSTQQQVSENVETLLRRAGLRQEDLARTLGINRVSLSQRITGRVLWRSDELDAAALALSVTVAELVTTIPSPDEWNRRRAPRAEPAGRGPRYLASPEPAYDGTQSLARLSPNAASDYPLSAMYLRLQHPF